MSKNNGLLLKILLIMIGMLIIGYILSVSIRMNMVKQPEGTYIRLQDALILTKALNETYKEDGRYIELQKILEKDRDSILTYEQFLELLDIVMERTRVEQIKKENREKYKGEFYVLKEDWYQVYDELLNLLEMREIIVPVNVTVMGTGSEVSDGNGTVLDENELLAEGGICLYESDLFMNSKYQVIKVYKKEETLLTVREVVSRGMSLDNMWIMEAEEGRVQIFYEGYEVWLPYGKAETAQREQIADLDFADGSLQSLHVKGEKINGKLLSVRDGNIEIEGLGKYPYEEKIKVYKLYGNLDECELSDIKIGYDFADFVLDDGTICAGLITRDEAMENIRVVIKNTDFAGAYHEEVKLTADTDFTVRYGKYDEMKSKEYKAGETVTIDGNSEYFIGDRIYIEPLALTGRIELLSVKRAQGTPVYRGKIEIAKTSDGLVIVNELLLEEYLYSVVPSEMPASYPLEALKSQAICARTYAYRHMSRSGIAGFGAHVDDSAGYQVYNNIAENAQTTKAVKETSGKLLYYGEELCGSYYYSTSCGFGTNAEIWKSDSEEDTSYLAAKRIGEEEEYTGEDMTEEEKFQSFITAKYPSDYESGEAWYRWTYEVEELDEERMLEALKKRYEVNGKLILTETDDGFESKKVEKLGKIKDIYIEKRLNGGVADELIIEGTKNTFKIISEHNIRYILNDGRSKVVRQDGSEIVSNTLLPSAYITITTSKEDDNVVGYSLAGGGYGHGVGMSQNGAKDMADKGFMANDILTFFYQACEVREIY